MTAQAQVREQKEAIFFEETSDTAEDLLRAHEALIFGLGVELTHRPVEEAAETEPSDVMFRDFWSPMMEPNAVRAGPKMAELPVPATRSEVSSAASKGFVLRVMGFTPTVITGPIEPRIETSSSSAITSYPELKRSVSQQLRNLFEETQDVRFRDGFESKVSKRFGILLRQYGTAAVSALAEIIDLGVPSTDALMETLHFMGRIEEPATKDERFKLLVRELAHGSPVIRDAAAIGLAYLNDGRAIDYLRSAALRETYPELKEDLQQVINELEG